MRAEERPFKKKKKNSAVMSLAFARDGTHCDVSHKMKYSLKKKKMRGAKFQGWQEVEREKKNLMSTSNQIRYLLLFY